ncbi:hypothetical protein Scep_026631 [Stephania cephalantha]|uniref:Uncharacterized protein n=1 Tax=Stephania cephalantha TaxID=152367 RepID=A0AAP0EQU1_9MAGN
MKEMIILVIVLILTLQGVLALAAVLLTMEKFENVDYNELDFDPHIYGLLTGASPKFFEGDESSIGLRLVRVGP